MFFGSLASKCLLLIVGKAPALLPPARLEEARDSVRFAVVKGSMAIATPKRWRISFSGPCELTLNQYQWEWRSPSILSRWYNSLSKGPFHDSLMVYLFAIGLQLWDETYGSTLLHLHPIRVA